MAICRVAHKVELVVREEFSSLSEKEIFAIGNDISFWRGLDYKEMYSCLAKLKMISKLIYQLKKEFAERGEALYVFLSAHFQVRGVQRFNEDEMNQLKCVISRAYNQVHRQSRDGKVRYVDNQTGFVLVLSKTGRNGIDLITCYKEPDNQRKDVSRKSKPRSKAYYKRLKKLKEGK